MKQDSVQTAEVAADLLYEEARYFEQLASQFPIYKRSLIKHSTDCSQVATNIRKKCKHSSPEALSISVRTANVFLTEGRRLELKLKINLLKQEATGLELGAGRWPSLETEFKTRAKECRQLISICQANISVGSSSKIKELLITATTLYEESIKLRKRQKAKRRLDARKRLLQKSVLLKALADQLQEKIKMDPAFVHKYEDLSSYCLQAAVDLEEKAEQGSINDIEKAITATDHFINRIKLNQTDIDTPEQELQPEHHLMPRDGGYPAVLPSVNERTLVQNETNEPEPVSSVYRIVNHDLIVDEPRTDSVLIRLQTGALQVSGALVPMLPVVSKFGMKVARRLIIFAERMIVPVVIGFVFLVLALGVIFLSGSGFNSIGLLK